MEPIVWIFLFATFSLTLAGWVMSARFRTVPSIERDAIPGVRISIIVPARNEESNLARLLPSIAGQDLAAHEILVVDDQSTDATAAVAESHGARVIPGQALPEGWYGKPWACRQGADAATGDWLLFLDADTELAPGAMARFAGLTLDSDSVHSVCPFHRVPSAVEKLSAFFNVIMLLGMNAFTLRGDRASGIGLFGQAMLVSRKQYEAVGGHEPVRNRVLENFHLSRHFAEAGFRCRCWLGRGTVAMRMFPGGIGEIVAGWSKGFVSGAGNTPRSAMIGISLWLSGAIMAAIGLSFLPLVSEATSWAILALYFWCVCQCFWLFRAAGSFGALSALLYPLPLAFYQAVFFRAAARAKKGGATQWKGRDVV